LLNYCCVMCPATRVGSGSAWRTGLIQVTIGEMMAASCYNLDKLVHSPIRTNHRGDSERCVHEMAWIESIVLQFRHIYQNVDKQCDSVVNGETNVTRRARCREWPRTRTHYVPARGGEARVCAERGWKVEQTANCGGRGSEAKVNMLSARGAELTDWHHN